MTDRAGVAGGTFGMGVAVGDYDNDGYPDMLVTSYGRCIRRELRSSPNHVHAMLQIAYELMKQGKYTDARPHAEKARELAPNLFAAHYAIGRVFLDTGELEPAIQAFETGVKLAPDSPEVRFSLARAYSRAGRSEDAARERAEFVRLDRARRTARSGAQSVGGKDDEPAEPPPPR